MRTAVIQAYEYEYVEKIKHAIASKDFVYIVELIEEIINRLNNLTPNRPDLHTDLKSAVDLELIKQMLDHNAFGSNEFYQIVESFLQRIELIQAPIDKHKCDTVRLKLNNLSVTMSNNMIWADVVAPFFLDINKLIDYIYKRREEALRDPIVRAMLQRVAELRNESSFNSFSTRL